MAGKGSAPGERRGGRVKGTPKKVTLEIRDLARAYGPNAIAELARLAGLTKDAGSENESTRVMAIKELIDRGYGKAAQIHAGAEDLPPVKHEHAFAGQLVKSQLEQIRSK
jgi:hypothetical protein